MPVLFIGHGSPINAIANNEFSQAWSSISKTIPKPRAILSISAHWETRGTSITGTQKYFTLHDFSGVPRELIQVKYPAQGSSWLVEQLKHTLDQVDLLVDQNWGLDHGTWAVLRLMYPKADIPVIQMSLNRRNVSEFHYQLGKWLRPLRDQGVLILGSGNLVHNLQEAVSSDVAFTWAQEYDAMLKEWILTGDHEAIVHYERSGKIAEMAVNTQEHYLPLLYILGASDRGEPVRFYCDRVTQGSISMRCVQFG